MPFSTILVDAPEGTMVDLGFLQNLGHPVLVCHGPDGAACPILDTGHCTLAEQAHGIVFMLDLDRPEHRQILATYKELLRPDLPIAVVVSDASQAVTYADLLAGFRVWDHAPAPGDLDALAAEVEAEELT